jgi:hypothetical protein
MPRYYLNVINSTDIAIDGEGQELADLAAARSQAEAGIRSLIADEARRGKIDLRGRIEIIDETGALLATVAFPQAFELHIGGGGA